MVYPSKEKFTWDFNVFYLLQDQENRRRVLDNIFVDLVVRYRKVMNPLISLVILLFSCSFPAVISPKYCRYEVKTI